MSYYTLKSQTPLNEISNKDQHFLNIAYNTAYDSNFQSSLRLGCCISTAKGCVLCS
jgi:hypothetical protein